MVVCWGLGDLGFDCCDVVGEVSYGGEVGVVGCCCEVCVGGVVVVMGVGGSGVLLVGEGGGEDLVWGLGLGFGYGVFCGGMMWRISRCLGVLGCLLVCDGFVVVVVFDCF